MNRIFSSDPPSVQGLCDTMMRQPSYQFRFDRNLESVEKYIQLIAKHNIVISDNDFIQLSAAIKAYVNPTLQETCFTKERAEHLAKMLSPLNISITVKCVESEKYDGLMDDLTIDVTRNRAATSSPTP
ncbi:MAG: hypothetical protein CL816_04870 [Coxiellaceae bacterium]|nr:hypothetical protein [Coxiellaceae bacterium]